MMNFGNSPLLDMGTSQQQPQMMDAELQKMYEAIQQKRASINMQTQVSSTPLFDEIDKIEDSFTDTQKQFLIQNQEYVESLQYVSKLVQDEELRIIRPRIEQTEQGKEALKHHLSIVTKLKRRWLRRRNRSEPCLMTTSPIIQIWHTRIISQ